MSEQQPQPKDARGMFSAHKRLASEYYDARESLRTIDNAIDQAERTKMHGTLPHWAHTEADVTRLTTIRRKESRPKAVARLAATMSEVESQSQASREDVTEHLDYYIQEAAKMAIGDGKEIQIQQFESPDQQVEVHKG